MDKIELGRLGIWRPWSMLDPELAKDVEDLGYGAIWIGGSPRGDLKIAERLLAGTDRIVIATGIVNMWATPAAEVAASYHRLNEAHGGRFLLGVGIGHPEATQEYRSPYETIVRYLDDLDAAGVPAGGRVLAALGPKVLRLAAERTAGAHPYFTTPEHTQQARETLGAGPLLVPEQKVVLDTDAARARATAREAARMVLGLRNYVGNFKRLGFSDADVAGGGSDALIDALVAQGGAAALAARVRGHLDAGADQVAVQVLGDDDPRPALREIAEALG
ncbi:LLM class F420-dependent oxidoreductase [Actinomadura geliboluensis]|uniref:LLM class F420-dependent oxidoreductase n=1 Tax=Actinomadura geliboluensis TaxID=882440 RepID=A0A5S4H938_9ACTN|nr:LLM class F420-dependent oxidoreductase [Actinomadura geliboluensis]TMR41264.1 LLM class F420-dependent oxidoreductase [Actinomadura geliboluensis]